MSEARRITPEEAHREVEAGQAILVCAYDDDAKCRQMKLDHALTLSELRRQLEALPRDRELIFYCA